MYLEKDAPRGVDTAWASTLYAEHVIVSVPHPTGEECVRVRES